MVEQPLGRVAALTWFSEAYLRKARKLRALLLSGADSEFQGLLEAVSCVRRGLRSQFRRR